MTLSEHASLKRPGRIITKDITIDSEATAISGVLEIGDNCVVGIECLSTGMLGSVLTFQGSSQGVSYGELIASDGNAVSISAGASKRIAVRNPMDFLASRYIKVRVGTSTGPTQQTAGAISLRISLANLIL